MADKDWDDRAEKLDKRPVRTSIMGVAGIWLVVMAVIALAIITTVLLWAFGVFTSDVKGAGDAEKINNSASNRIEKQEWFEDQYADIEIADKNIVVAAEKLASDPTNSYYLTEYNGLRQFCNDLVGDYNAEARKFTAEQWRAADLPAKIDDTDRKTDCKEDTP